MIADLKEKLAGFDKKRLYTAGAALVIAGAAGHFMQRGANAPGADAPMIAGSEPAVVQAGAGLEITPAVEIAAAIEIAPAVEITSPVEATASGAVPEIAPSPVMAEATDMPRIAPAPRPEFASAPAMAETAEPEMAADRPEVTRAAAEPVLAIPNPTPEGDLAEAPVTLAALGETLDIAAEPAPPSAEDLAAGCDIAFSATPLPGAMVALSIEAPCNSGEKIRFEHVGLKFSEQLDPDGGLDLTVPAMAEDAIFVATFADNQERATEIQMPDFDRYERIALVWRGATGLQLHALENGANYGEPGHVWAEQPEMPIRAVDGKGGFVSVLGSTAEGFAADVYTYPAGLMADGSGPEVSIETQVMENTCGNEIDGLVMRSNPGRAPTTTDLSLVVPGCDAVGQYLVLKNLPQDLKIARN